MKQPTTPAEFRDLMADIMAVHERTTCSPEATALGAIFMHALDIARIATPGDPNGQYRAKFYQLNPTVVVQDAERCRERFANL